MHYLYITHIFCLKYLVERFLAPFIDLKMGYWSKEKDISVRRMEFVSLEQYSVMDPLVPYSVSILQDHVFQVRFIFGYISILKMDKHNWKYFEVCERLRASHESVNCIATSCALSSLPHKLWFSNPYIFCNLMS